MRRRTAVLGGTLLTVALAATVANAWARSDREVDEPAAAPVTTTSTSTTTRAAPERAVALQLEVPTLPQRGIGVVQWDSETVLLLDDEGHVLARGASTDAQMISPQDVAVASVSDRLVELTRPPLAPTAPDGCLAGNTVGERTVKRCGSPDYLPPRIEVTDRAGTRTLINAPPFATGGGWRSAKLSPDGRTVLAQWSGECEVQHTMFVDVASGRVTATTGEDAGHWNLAPASTSAGWRPDGLAVISTGRWGCGMSGDPGVYVVAPDGIPKLLRPATTDDAPGIFAWQRDTIAGACDLPVEAMSMPEGWDPTPRPGSPADQPVGGAIAHWVGPRPHADVVLVVGRDGAGLVAPLASGTDPLSVFTSMGNPAFILPIHEAFAAQVDPPNAPAACSPTFLIGQSMTADTLHQIAESLRSSDAPTPAEITISGEAVRGAQVSMRATGPVWPVGQVEVELANPDGFGAMGLVLADPDENGPVEASFTVPSTFSYEGVCKGTGHCDLISSSVGPMRIRFRETVGRRRIVGEGTFEVVAARRNVPYPAAIYGECGPVRTEFDGVTWVAAESTTIGHDLVEGILTIRSATRATFRTRTTGAVVELRKSPHGYSC